MLLVVVVWCGNGGVGAGWGTAAAKGGGPLKHRRGSTGGGELSCGSRIKWRVRHQDRRAAGARRPGRTATERAFAGRWSPRRAARSMARRDAAWRSMAQHAQSPTVRVLHDAAQRPEVAVRVPRVARGYPHQPPVVVCEGAGTNGVGVQAQSEGPTPSAHDPHNPRPPSAMAGTPRCPPELQKSGRWSHRMASGSSRSCGSRSLYSSITFLNCRRTGSAACVNARDRQQAVAQARTRASAQPPPRPAAKTWRLHE